MKGTFTLPDGSKVRTGSHRRYVAWRFWYGGQRWVVEARSDNLTTIRRRSAATDVIIDTATGEVIR